jgi:hypothetical protein
VAHPLLKSVGWLLAQCFILVGDFFGINMFHPSMGETRKKSSQLTTFEARIELYINVA